MEYCIHLDDESVEAIKEACSTEVEELEVTENGTYNAPSGKAYSPVTVNVPNPSTGTLQITENGEGIDVTQYAAVDVNVSGGDTEQWKTLFDGEITTVSGQGGSIDYDNLIDNDIIKVTFDGNEYTCEKIDAGGGYMYGGFVDGRPDFSEYPFIISSTPNNNLILTESAGTYSLKIEAQESGEDNDFSIAEVTFVGDNNGKVLNLGYLLDDELVYNIVSDADNQTFNVPLYKNSAIITGNAELALSDIVSGDAEIVDGQIVIHGNCTLKCYENR